MADYAIWSVPIAWGLAVVPHITKVIILNVKGRVDNAKPRQKDAEVASLPKEYQQLAVRLSNCHANQLESLGYFAGAVSVAVAVQVPPAILSKLTGFYIKSRIAYTLAYAVPQIGKGVLRSLSFVAAMTSIGMIYAAAAETARSSY